MSISTPSRNPPGVNAFTRWFCVLILVVFCAGGAAALVNGWKRRGTNSDTASWPTAEGTVERGWVKSIETKTGSNSGKERRGEIQEVMIDYTFTAEGQTIRATSPGPSQCGEEGGKVEAQAIADSFVPGRKIDVFYKPGEPQESRLRRVEVSSSAWLFWAIGGGLTIPATLVGIWWMVFRYERGKG
jgi:hypothetical protein